MNEVDCLNEIIELKKAWEATIVSVNATFDRLLNNIGGEETTVMPTEYAYPLTADTSIFVGKKPVAVMFGDKRTEVDNWRKVFSVILAKCNSDAICHENLMYLRDKVAGRDRVLLSHSPDGMRRHIKIDEDMYAEACYGTGTLLYILRDRILAPARFDFSDISIVIKRG